MNWALSVTVIGMLTTSAMAGTACRHTTTAHDMVRGQDLTGQTHVITGGDTGIGYETALALASAKASVILLCRDSAKPTGKCATAKQNITRVTGSDRVSLIPLDLSDFSLVRAAAATLKQQTSRIDSLICNAGMAWDGFCGGLCDNTKDGFNRVFQINFLGHHLLVDELLPILRSSQGRVINVASASSQMACPWGCYPLGCANLKNLHAAATHQYLNPTREHPEKFHNNTMRVPCSNYGLSKYLEVFESAELSRREASNGILAFSLHPGVIKSPMTDEAPPSTVKSWCLGQTPCPMTSPEGASTQTYLVSAPRSELAKDGGKYFTVCQPSSSVRSSYSLMHGEAATVKYQSGIFDFAGNMTQPSAKVLTFTV